MTHKDYLATCDEAQTQCLLEMCQRKLDAIKDEGWEYLWVVSNDNVNLKWFHYGSYSAALDYMYARGNVSAYNGNCEALHINQERVRPSEVKGYVK
jgi:hypothetical protein